MRYSKIQRLLRSRSRSFDYLIQFIGRLEKTRKITDQEDSLKNQIAGFFSKIKLDLFRDESLKANGLSSASLF